MKLSFILPCYNSEATLNNVVMEIKKVVAEKADYTYEIILINDNSLDNTLNVIRNLCKDDVSIKGIHLSKNFGQHAALMAGFEKSCGDIIVCLDDDGQTPANEVFNLINVLSDEIDVVYARYSEKKHNIFRNFGSKLNSAMLNYILEKPKDLYISSYFIAKRYVIDEVLKYQNPYPYVIGLVLRTTTKIANVTVTHRNREIGNSGYSMKKLLGLWLNGFTSFSVKPLRIATIAGSIFAFVGFIYAIYAIINKILTPEVPLGWSSLIAALFITNGIILIMLGLIGEYIGRIFISMNNSPQFVIKEIIEKDD